MRPLGEFSHVSSGYVLFRAKNYPPLYCGVATSEGEEVGKVVDVIGPVSYPYFVVHTEKEMSQKLWEDVKSSRLYIVEGKRRKPFGRKKSR